MADLRGRRALAFLMELLPTAQAPAFSDTQSVAKPTAWGHVGIGRAGLPASAAGGKQPISGRKTKQKKPAEILTLYRRIHLAQFMKKKADEVSRFESAGHCSSLANSREGG